MRRMRHLDASRAGAAVVLDARYIAGSDGDLLSSWTDRTGNGYTPTATTTQRPTLKLAQTAGQPVVRFDGAATVMIAAANLQMDQHTIIVLAKSGTRAAPTQHFVRKGFGTPSLNWGLRRTDASSALSFVQGGSTNYLVSHPMSGSSYVVLTHRFDRINVSAATNGAAFTNTANTNPVPVTDVRFCVGAGPFHDNSIPSSFTAHLDGDIAQLVMFPVALSPFMRKRFEHAAARSFGVACA